MMTKDDLNDSEIKIIFHNLRYRLGREAEQGKVRETSIILPWQLEHKVSSATPPPGSAE